MANKNYTLQNVKVTKPSGSTTSNHDIFILPNPGYIVDESYFTIGTLPTGVEATPSNVLINNVVTKVKITVTLTNYSIPSSDSVLKIPINGIAKLQTNPTSIPINISIPQNVGGSSNAIVTNLNASLTDSTSNSVINLSGNISQEQDDPEEYELIATLSYGVATGGIVQNDATTDFSADDISIPGFDLVLSDTVYEITHDTPSNNYVSQGHSSPYVVVVEPTQETTADSLYGLAHTQTANVYVNTKVPLISGEEYQLEVSNGTDRKPSITIPPAVTKEIKAIDFGNNIVDSRGETRTIKVYGDIGASFNFHAIDAGADGSGDSVFTSGSFYDSGNVEFTIASNSTFKRGESFSSFTLIMPSKSATHNYKIYLEPTSGTTAVSGIPLTGSKQTLVQHTNPTLTMQVANTSSTFRLGRNHTHGIVVPTGGLTTNVFTDNPEYFSLYYEIYASDGTSVLNRVGSSDPIVPTFNSSGSSINGWSNSDKSTNGGYHLEVSNASTSFFLAGSNTPMTNSYVNAERVVIKADFSVIEQGVEAVTMSLNLANILTEVRG